VGVAHWEEVHIVGVGLCVIDAGELSKFCTLLEWEKTWKATDLGQDVNQDVFKENPFMM